MATLWLNLSFSEQLEAWLLTLICMSSLKRVTIDAYEVPELQSTVVLPPQVELHIYMVASSYSPMSLAWLRLQSSSKVYMHIRLSRQTPSQAQQAVLELQTLRIYVLHIQTRYSHFSAELQHNWGQLKSCKFLHLAFQSQTGVVHALPICKRVHVSGPMSSPTKPVQRSLCVQWAAIGNRPGKVYISLYKSQRLRVEGHADPLLSCAAPWQLKVRSGAGVKGLPPSRATQKVYFLQNAVADAAG